MNKYKITRLVTLVAFIILAWLMAFRTGIVLAYILALALLPERVLFYRLSPATGRRGAGGTRHQPGNLTPLKSALREPSGDIRRPDDA